MAEMNRILAYVAHRIPQIADSITDADDAMRGGNARAGSFELWDVIANATRARDDARVASMRPDMLGQPVLNPSTDKKDIAWLACNNSGACAMPNARPGARGKPYADSSQQISHRENRGTKRDPRWNAASQHSRFRRQHPLKTTYIHAGNISLSRSRSMIGCWS